MKNVEATHNLQALANSTFTVVLYGSGYFGGYAVTADGTCYTISKAYKSRASAVRVLTAVAAM